MTDRFNQLKGNAANFLGALLCVFVLVGVNTNLFDEQPNLALFGLLGLLLVFLGKPLVKGWGDKPLFRIIDAVLIVATLIVFGYVFIQSESMLERFWVDGTLLGDRAGNETTFDFVIAGIGLVLVLEGTRRAIGWTLPILCCVFIAYAIYGQSMPDWLFPHRGFSWGQISQKTFLQSGGVFGIALRVMFFYVFLFVFFGTLLEQTGATGYVIKFARRLFKNSVGGPAKVAVVSSGLMGSLSGSAVANTATTGTFTIPLMKSSGFEAESAAGVEAAASSGGALMPPIMGAGAYMMLEMVEPAVTYVEIIKAALIPAILYYTALLLTVHFHSLKTGASKEEVKQVDDQTPMSMYQGFVFFSSFAILIYMLTWQGSTPFRAVSVSLVGILVMSLFSSHTRLVSFKDSSWVGRVIVSLVALGFLLVIGSWIFSESSIGLGVGAAEASPEGESKTALPQFPVWANWLITGVLVAVVVWFCDASKIYKALIGAAKGGVALIVAASCVGIILGIVGMTGLGASLPAKIQAFAGESSILALLLLMVSTIILGMGLPSAVCYLLMAILVGSVLKTLQTPPLAAHLFIFYFGMMSMVTPPVALAAYAGAAIAKADVIKSAFAAFRFALVGFALPFAFVLRPELLMLTPENTTANPVLIAAHVATTLVGVIGLAASVAGYGFRTIAGLWRIPLFVCSIAIFFTRWDDWQFIAHLVAVVIVIVLMAINFKSQKDL